MTLGILAVTPRLASAAFPERPTVDPAASRGSAAKSKNQKVAEEIAMALKKANFHGFEIDIEFRDGVATLRGKVSDPRLKVRASQLVADVAGVRRVDNQLSVISSSRGPIRQVDGTEVPPAPGAAIDASIQSNQERAMQIGRSLQSAGLSGYDIEVMYQNGQALLRGSVATPQQRESAARVASSVPGVLGVNNQLRVEGQPQGDPRYGMAAYQQGAPPAEPSQGTPMPATGPDGPQPPGMVPPPYPGAPMGPPPPAGAPIPGGPVFDNPRVPEYAWPSYGQYPNYAAVTYPSQYSASAWPYIGPFYPYPQVPLNWRKVTLEWDDGYWDLKFDSKTDRWWWFLHPKNW
jgi:osmotically-inducible protein OsmY